MFIWGVHDCFSHTNILLNLDFIEFYLHTIKASTGVFYQFWYIRINQVWGIGDNYWGFFFSSRVNLKKMSGRRQGDRSSMYIFVKADNVFFWWCYHPNKNSENL